MFVSALRSHFMRRESEALEEAFIVLLVLHALIVVFLLQIFLVCLLTVEIKDEFASSVRGVQTLAWGFLRAREMENLEGDIERRTK